MLNMDHYFFIAGLFPDNLAPVGFGCVVVPSMNLTSEMKADLSVEDGHLCNMGKMIEELEGKLRNQLDQVYFGKTKEMVCTLRPPSELLSMTLPDRSKVGGRMSRVQSWNEIVNNLVARLSKWKINASKVGVRFNAHLSYVIDQSPHEGKNVKHSHRSIWLDIVREMEQLKNHGTYLIGFIHKKMGNAADTSFWEDVWRGDVGFKYLYPRVYALESCKNVTVAVKMSHENVGYSLRRIPRGGVEQVQFLELLASMEGAALFDMRDRWVWSLEGSGEFSVASVRRLIDERWLPEVSTKTRWITVVPIKVNVHA
ncbi:RNA-directed DNA polymerase, eukaryota, reverse transcriptase zinc-binding domain protein [Tanacetum coccineum]